MDTLVPISFIDFWITPVLAQNNISKPVIVSNQKFMIRFKKIKPVKQLILYTGFFFKCLLYIPVCFQGKQLH